MLKIKLIAINAMLFLGVFLVNLIAAIHIRWGHIALFVLFCAFEFLYSLLVAFFICSVLLFESNLNKNDLFARTSIFENADLLDGSARDSGGRSPIRWNEIKIEVRPPSDSDFEKSKEDESQKSNESKSKISKFFF